MNTSVSLYITLVLSCTKQNKVPVAPRASFTQADEETCCYDMKGVNDLALLASADEEGRDRKTGVASALEEN